MAAANPKSLVNFLQQMYHKETIVKNILFHQKYQVRGKKKFKNYDFVMVFFFFQILLNTSSDIQLTMPKIILAGQPGPAPKKEGLDFHLFGKKPEQSAPQISALLSQVSEMSRRLRLLESRSTDLNRKIEVNEKNMLTERKRFNQELKTMDSEILELKRTVDESKTKIDVVVSELENFAPKEDIESLKKYIELWEPVNFATREEVEKMIKEALEEK